MTAEEIRAARVTLGLSRKEFAAALYCGRSTVCGWERGEPISAWFAGEIRALLRRHSPPPVSHSPFLPIPAWRIAEIRRGPEPCPPPDPYIPNHFH